jgi:hypothetical protein
VNLARPRATPLLRLAFASFVVLLFAPAAIAQTGAAGPRAGESAPSSRPDAQTHAGATADESFGLDIPSRRISEEEFHASTAVSAVGGDGALRLRVGAVVTAARIELLLRNVRGSVRFRADLGPVLRLLGARREADAPAPPTDSSP